MCHKDRVNPIDEAFMTKYLLALDQLATLALTKRNSSVTFNISSSPTADTDRHGEQTSLEDAISAVELLDCLLAKAHKEKLPPTMAWNFVLQHVTGQLYLHVATLLLKRPLKESYNWQEARSWAAALLLTAYSVRPPSSLSQEGWFLALDSPKRRLHQNVFLRAHHRLSVSGHMLHTLCKSEVDENRWLSNLKEQICMPEVRKKVHRGLFDSEASTSWLLQDPTLDTCAFEFPTFVDLLRYDQESQWLHPGSLNHLVWLALQWRTFQDKKLVTSEHWFEAQVFEELPLKPSTFDSAEPETLSQMDTLAFLEATCFCADQSLERGSLRLSKGPLSLPPQAGLQLCTESQANWWSAAYQQSTNNARNRTHDMRRILQRGLEVIRGIGNHGMELALVAHLAKTFASKIPLKELGKFNSCASSSSKTPTMTDKYKAGEPEITVKTKISASSTVQQLPNNISNQQPAGTEFRFGVGGSDQKPSTDRIMKLSNLDSQKVNGSASTDAELQTACSLPFQSHTAPPLTRPPYSAPAVSGERADSPQSQSEAPEEYVPNGEFEPVVELPKLIEVKTGEEDEEVLFCEQAKLYRYDAKAKEWKERGTGQLKILRHMKTRLCRVVMRRDHVLNLCANHNILPEMKLHPLSTRGHAWSWCACDYSEGKDCFEILAVRFKTQEQAEVFKEVFESCKDKVQSTVLQNNSERDRDAHEEQTEAPKSLPQSNQLKPEPRDYIQQLTTKYWSAQRAENGAGSVVFLSRLPVLATKENVFCFNFHCYCMSGNDGMLWLS
ncbi:hypothetical protein V5799_008773 [Amblyomma americanum]|uniref:RanBD1 domain-containing protein n=1 Tax=Amblyomma americanum TaxID=6943 RepID=A0AAQ4FDW5_AMBAM